MVDYQNGKIYKIMFMVTDELYVGSTAQPLKDRMSQHRCQRSNKAKIQAFKTNTNIRMILLEKYSCGDRDELNEREQYWIDKLKPTLNKIEASTHTQGTSKATNEGWAELIQEISNDHRAI